MPNYWIIAPYDATQAETWEKVWQFDLQNNVISIGWGTLGEISNYDEDQLKAAIANTFPDKTSATQTRCFNMIWNFFHTIKPGDIVIARKGRKFIAAVGTVLKSAYFDSAKNIEAHDPEDPHYYFLDVQWHDTPRNKDFGRQVFGIQTIHRSSEAQFRKLTGTALYLNGVFEGVLQEIIVAQQNQPDLICYLQPYSSGKIKLLAESLPGPENIIHLYISTTDDLGKVTYRAKIVGWEDKREIEDGRLQLLNEHIKHYQPGETEIYLTLNGKTCVNLISIISLEQLTYSFVVSNLIKLSDNKPYKKRTQAGNWSEVYMVPEWLGTQEPMLEEQLNDSLAEEIKKSQKLPREERQRRLEQAPKIPEKVQVISVAYRRNPDVVAEVLARAKGKCEECRMDAPFLRASDGTPYLEVHHRKPLAEDGEDTVDNAIALCPNCHRKAHYGQ